MYLQYGVLYLIMTRPKFAVQQDLLPCIGCIKAITHKGFLAFAMIENMQVFRFVTTVKFRL